MDAATIAVAGPLLPVIHSEWTGGPRHAGDHQGALDPAGDASEGSVGHAPRVPKTPLTGVTPGLEGFGPTGRCFVRPRCRRQMDWLRDMTAVRSFSG
jgi:hypothetical protein